MFQSSGICSGHQFGRCAIYPKFIRDRDAFDPEQAFQFSELKIHSLDGSKPKGTGIYALSLASEYLAPGPDAVHTYGQSAAQEQNKSFEARKGELPDPMSLYIGFFQFDGSDFFSYIPLLHQLIVRWLPEHGQDCHFQIEACVLDKGTKAERRDERAKLSRHLWSNSKSFVNLPSENHVANEAELSQLVEVSGSE